MANAPVYEKISVSNSLGQLIDRFSVECKTDIYSESVKRIISVAPSVDTDSVNVSDASVSYGGRISLIITYENDEEQLVKSQVNARFKGKLADPALLGATYANVNAEVEKTEPNLGGIKLSFNVYLKATVWASVLISRDALVGGENLVCDGYQEEVYKSLGVKETNYPHAEQFDLAYAVKEVLSHSAQVAVTSCQCGVGCIIVDGEAYVNMIFLKRGEKVEIQRESKTFPFRAEIECEDAMPANVAVATACVKSFKTDVAVIEEENRSECEVSVIVGITGEAKENKTVKLIKDAFCLSDKISLEKETVRYTSCTEVRCGYAKTQAVANIEDIPEGARLICTAGERVEITESRCLPNGLEIFGALYGYALFIGSDGKVFSRKIETPFTANAECLSPDCNFNALCVTSSAEASLNGLNELIITLNLTLSIYPQEEKELLVIKGVNSQGEKTAETCPISVYIARENESLWEISKRLNVSPDDLVNSNRELQFPLTGAERIVVYRQK